MGKPGQPWVPFFVETGTAVFPRRYAQSTSERIVSHETSPPDSRSMLIASDSPQVLQPYATLLRWRSVVPQRIAKASRSASDLPLRNSLSSIATLHHTVLIDATPNGEFTKRCQATSIPGMDASDLEAQKKIRIENLTALISVKYAGNAAALARACKKLPQYINDLVGGRKSFGEKAAWALEDGAGLIRGQLSIKNSKLIEDPSKARPAPANIQPIYEDLDENQRREAYEAIMAIRASKRRRKGTGAA